jgi:hypothetical protein
VAKLCCRGVHGLRAYRIAYEEDFHVILLVVNSREGDTLERILNVH